MRAGAAAAARGPRRRGGGKRQDDGGDERVTETLECASRLSGLFEGMSTRDQTDEPPRLFPVATRGSGAGGDKCQGARWRWVTATARASAASARGLRRRPGSPATIWATWAFSARPPPTTARFTRAGGYSAIGSPARAQTSSATPRAWPSLRRGLRVLGEEDAPRRWPPSGAWTLEHLDERAPRWRRDARRSAALASVCDDAVRDVHAGACPRRATTPQPKCRVPGSSPSTIVIGLASLRDARRAPRRRCRSRRRRSARRRDRRAPRRG